MALDRALADARDGEGRQRVQVEGQPGLRRPLGQHGQPVGRLGAEEAGVQRHRRHVQQHAVQHLAEILHRPDRDARRAGRIEAQQKRARAVAQLLERAPVRLGRIGMPDPRAQVPGPAHVAGRGGTGGQGGRVGLGHIERLDRQAVGRAADQALERRPLQALLGQGAPLVIGRDGEVFGEVFHRAVMRPAPACVKRGGGKPSGLIGPGRGFERRTAAKTANPPPGSPAASRLVANPGGRPKVPHSPDDATGRLQLPYLAAGQMQKHVTLNEALSRLDALVQTSVVSRSTAEQPSDPEEGRMWLLPDAPSGEVWAGWSPGDLVRVDAGGWTRVPVLDGLIVHVADEGVLVIRRDGQWRPAGQALGEIRDLARFGLNTGPDEANPFAARLNKALWMALPAGEGGDGDLRFTFNKEGPADVLSLLFQSGWGGRAELGLIGSDDFSLKVSADGGDWREVMSVDRSTGAAAFARGVVRCETTRLTDDGEYAPPAWARRLRIVCIGGGGGGGSGAAGAASTDLCGGAGG